MAKKGSEAPAIPARESIENFYTYQYIIVYYLQVYRARSS
jgi:hypothetical protein